MARAYPARRRRSGHEYQRVRGIVSAGWRTRRGAGRRLADLLPKLQPGLPAL